MSRGVCLPPRPGFRLRRRSRPPPSAGTPRNAPNARNKDRYQAFGFIQSIYYWPELWAQNLTAHFRAFPFFSRTSHAAFFSGFLTRISPLDPSGIRSWMMSLMIHPPDPFCSPISPSRPYLIALSETCATPSLTRPSAPF